MKKQSAHKHILVTGAPRSGTTFAGTMLAAPLSIGYIKEPFNRHLGIHGIDNWFTYVKKGMENESTYHRIIKHMLQGKASYRKLPPSEGATFADKAARAVIKNRASLKYFTARYSPFVCRFLIKDPIACLASQYMHREFGVEVIILIRHPAAYAASIKRLGWPVGFGMFFRQKQLMEDYLAPYLQDTETSRLSFIEAASLRWKCLYHVLSCFLEQNPEIIGVRHEDISRNAPEQFKRLYRRLGMPYTKRTERKVHAYTSGINKTDPAPHKAHVLKRNSRDNIKRWKKTLSRDEISTIRRITEEVAVRFYNDADW